MDKETKIKVIIGAVFALLILGVVWLFLSSGSTSTEQEEVSTRAVDSTEVSINDIMSQMPENPNSGYQTETPQETPLVAPPQEEYEDSEEIEQLQAQLKRNQSKITSRSYDEEPYNPPTTRQTPPRASDIERPMPTPSVSSQESNQETVVTPPSEEDAAQRVAPPKSKPSRFNSGLKRASEVRVSVFGNQEVKNGSLLKMVLSQAITLEGTTIPKGTAVYGSVRIDQNRLNVTISNVTFRGKSYPFPKVAYDKDGLAGINVPEVSPQEESVAREIGEDVANRSGVLSGAIGSVVSSVSGILRRKNGSSYNIIVKSNYQLVLK